MHSAAESGQINVFVYLLLNGADSKSVNKDGKTPFDIAFAFAQKEKREDLKKDLEWLQKNFNVFPKLHIASFYGLLDLVSTYIEKEGALVTEQEKETGTTALHCACMNGQLEVIKYLIQKGASLEIKDNGGKTPVDLAKNEVKDDIKWMGVEEKRGIPRLHSACVDGNLKSVADFLKQGKVKVNEQDKDGNNALHYAVMYGHPEVAAYLILKNDRAEQINQNWLMRDNPRMEQDALIEAMNKGKVKFLSGVANNAGKTPDVVVLPGISQEIKDKIKWIFETVFELPLHIACFFGFLDMVQQEEEKLDPKCISDNKKDPASGMTPLHMACKAGHLDIVKYLLEKGADVKALDNNGNSCLHYASMGGEPKIFHLLIDSIEGFEGIDPNLKNKKGQTPVDVAKDEKTKKAIEEMVREYQKEKEESQKELEQSLKAYEPDEEGKE